MKALFFAACLAGCGDAAVQSTKTEEERSSASTYAQTRYPIVLVHGMAGFTDLLGVMEYFYGIPDSLRSAGATVFVTQASPFNSPEARGEQVLAQLESILARTGYAKANLIGHSQGGLDARYVASVRPELVASLTTVGSPHKGAALADYLRAHFANGAFDQAVLNTLGDSLGWLLGLLEGKPTLPEDTLAGLDALTSSATFVFNETYPAGVPESSCGEGASALSGIQYFSWSGSTVFTNVLDTSDYGFGLASLVAAESSDGLVGHCSSHFGQVIRDDYRMNHLDEVNQLFGLVSPFETSPVELFRIHANRLKALGL
jgi:triacylglycerol lipase